MKNLIYIACRPKEILYGLQPGMFCSPRFGHLLPLWDKITILGPRWEFLNYYLSLFRCWTCEYLCIHITYLLRGALLIGAVACCSEVTRGTAALAPSASLSRRVLLGGTSAVAANTVGNAGGFDSGRSGALPGGLSWLHHKNGVMPPPRLLPPPPPHVQR